MPVEKQVVAIYALTKKYLLDVDVDKVMEFEAGLLEYIDTKYPEIYTNIRKTKQMDEATEELLKKAIEQFKVEFNK